MATTARTKDANRRQAYTGPTHFVHRKRATGRRSVRIVAAASMFAYLAFTGPGEARKSKVSGCGRCPRLQTTSWQAFNL